MPFSERQGEDAKEIHCYPTGISQKQSSCLQSNWTQHKRIVPAGGRDFQGALDRFLALDFRRVFRRDQHAGPALRPRSPGNRQHALDWPHRAFWQDEYDGYDARFQREAIAPIQNKLGQFLLNPAIRNILGQVKCKGNIPFTMNDRRLFIANLSSGKLGHDKANVLGSLLVTQFQLSAMARADQPEEERKDFSCSLTSSRTFQLKRSCPCFPKRANTGFASPSPTSSLTSFRLRFSRPFLETSAPWSASTSETRTPKSWGRRSGMSSGRSSWLTLAAMRLPCGSAKTASTEFPFRRKHCPRWNCGSIGRKSSSPGYASDLPTGAAL
ncbi:MAG: hypothetical protein ABR924_22060 [Terracidiphilus sp.]